jgi:hypothetical protein
MSPTQSQVVKPAKKTKSKSSPYNNHVLMRQLMRYIYIYIEISLKYKDVQ